MFIIFGTRTVKQRVRDSISRESYCPGCHSVRQFLEYEWQRYFTLFFTPVIPLERGEKVLTCTSCDRSYNMPVEADIRGIQQDQKAIIQCLHCARKLRIPVRDKPIKVTCPHCQKAFEVEHREGMQRRIRPRSESV